MDPQIQTSFIPKESMAKPMEARSPLLGVISIITGIVFVLSLASWGGVYLYRKSLDNDIATLRKSLTQKREQFEEKTLVEFGTLDRLLNVADKLISQHTTIIPLLNVIEDRTLQGVRFKNFAFSIGAPTNGAAVGQEIRIKMSGEAKNYTAVAQQSDLLGNKDHRYKDNILNDVVFSNLNLDQVGNVTFDVTFTVNPGLLSFKNPIDPKK